MDRYFKVNGKLFFAFGGQSQNCSAYHPEDLEVFFTALERSGGNTAEIPVSWEAVEPEEGRFDFTMVDRVISGAQSRGFRLIILWFATWKNGAMKFAPEWVKADRKRFHRVIAVDGSELPVLSSHCMENRKADARAFAAMMAHIHDVDREGTVIGMQVENESGILGRTCRDHGTEANREFAAPVPACILEGLKRHPNTPEYGFWQACGGKASGSWTEVFGDHAAELFTAWSIAGYINAVVQAGKAEHDIPMFVNTWLDNQDWEVPGVSYPSGAPLRKTFNIWKWTAPDIDALAPDIYKLNPEAFRDTCAFYSRENNPLIVPESSPWNMANARNMMVAIGKYRAAGYFLFGIEDTLTSDGGITSDAKVIFGSFHAVSAALPLIMKYSGTPRLHTIVEEEHMYEQQLLKLDGYVGLAKFDIPNGADFRHKDQPIDGERGRGMVIQTADNEFYVLGGGFVLFLRRKCREDDYSEVKRESLVSYRRVEEGRFDGEGRWICERIRNGDASDYGIWVYPDVGVVHVIMDE